MGKSAEYRWGSISITGNFRENNEDRFLIDPLGRYFLVADGMGGQSAGEKASELAVEIIARKLNAIDFSTLSPTRAAASIDDAVAHANSEIMALGELEPTFKNMGTTITFIVAVSDQLFVGGVGDSRAYLLRDGTLTQLTEDHSLTQALVKAGTISAEEARTHRYKNVLYRYLGTRDGGAATEPRQIEPRSGDRLMLCSDGVSDGATQDEILRVLTDRTDPQVAAEELVRTAQNGGSKDNITCVVVHVL